MSKRQFDAVGAQRGPESGFILPEKIVIAELLDKHHPKHHFYKSRLSRKNPDIIALTDAIDECGWETGSIAFLYRDGDDLACGAGRRRTTAAVWANERRRARKDRRPLIKVQYLPTADAATAEAIENAGRVSVPPMQLARDFVALRGLPMSDTRAAAKLVITVEYAHQLEACLSLPLDQQTKINNAEIAVDTGARLAKQGSRKARAIVESATQADGTVDPAAARKGVRELHVPGSRALPAATLEAMQSAALSPAPGRTVEPEDEEFERRIRQHVAATLAAARGNFKPALGLPILRETLVLVGYDEKTGKLKLPRSHGPGLADLLTDLPAPASYSIRAEARVIVMDGPGTKRRTVPIDEGPEAIREAWADFTGAPSAEQLEPAR
jgi:hypothetical protein